MIEIHPAYNVCGPTEVVFLEDLEVLLKKIRK